jgi:hypothetical protein
MAALVVAAQLDTSTAQFIAHRDRLLKGSLVEPEEVERVLAKGEGRVLMVDFNRRFSPLTRAVGAALAGRGGPSRW